MAASSRRTAQGRPLDFRGFLNDTQKSESDRSANGGKMESKTKANGVSEASVKNIGNQYDYMKYSSYSNDEPMPDAASEKEQGNEYFKQKKFAKAIECYSRSIGLSPTAVAFANRAMAYLKLRRFEEAENDCTEALNRDDHYVKAYSRRITARKELRKLEEAMDDAEFAVSLEPNNPELRRQYSEIKALRMEKMTKKTSTPTKHVVSELDKAGAKKDGTSHPPGTSQKESFMEVDAPPQAPMEIGESPVEGSKGGSGANFKYNSTQQVPMKHLVHASDHAPSFICQDSQGVRQRSGLESMVQNLASHAISQYMANNVKSIKAPKTAYEFEVSWRALSGNSEQQIQLLKSIAPASLPQIFKNALSAPFLIDIVKCTATIFQDGAVLAVAILENLAKVPRFDMIIMCLSPMQRSELKRIWEQVFLVGTTSEDQIEILTQLWPKYVQKEWQGNMFTST